MRPKTLEELQKENDEYRALVEQTRERVTKLERVIELLIVAGFVTADKVKQARELAK